ncbi:MAG TPA: hypothetical protein VNW68_02395 [Candidatus Limnocylindria bacterium]|nr:hypothetical protein [Candidatus Limnocylindria bacterium]
MQSGLRDVAREFARGETTLEVLRAAARTERMDRHVAEEILKLISAWESRAWPDVDRARNDLRAGVKQLVPADPPPSASRRPPGESIYDAGFRGQRRRP